MKKNLAPLVCAALMGIGIVQSMPFDAGLLPTGIWFWAGIGGMAAVVGSRLSRPWR